MAIKKQRIGVIFIMASSPKVEYPKAKNYIAKFGHNKEISYLLLCYNIDRKFQFVGLKAGSILNLVFDSVEDAEAWLYSIAEVIAVDVIEPTYVP